MTEKGVVKTSALTQMIVDRRKRGLSWARIAEDLDITPEKAYTDYMRFMESQNDVSEAEYRWLQLQRLEHLIDRCWDLVEHGSLDHIDMVLKIVKEISKLLDLYKDKAQTVVQVIDNRQVHLVTAYVDAVSDTLKQRVLQTVTAKKAREAIESSWDSWLADASAEPLKMIETDKVTI